MAKEGLTAFQAVNRYFEEAARLVDLDEQMWSVLTSTYREISVQIPVRLDNGDLVVVRGYRVQHNGARGPYKGGVRYHPDHRPGGGTGARVAHDLEDGAAGPALRRGQGRHRGRPTPDEPARAAAHDPPVHQRHRARHRPVPGHPRPRHEHQRPDDGVDDGRLLGDARLQPLHRDRQAARPRGAPAGRRPPGGASSTSWRPTARSTGLDVAGLRVAVQGFGNVGSWAAVEAAARGATVVAASDRFGGVRHEAGLDVERLVEVAREGGAVGDTDQPGVDRVSNEELLTSPCDVLVPAALGEVIDADNARHVQASVVVEAANYPVTPGRRQDPRRPGHHRGAGRAGQRRRGDRVLLRVDAEHPAVLLEGARFNDELRDRLRGAYHATAAAAAELGCTLRQAAFAIGIRKVAQAARLRGYV